MSPACLSNYGPGRGSRARPVGRPDSARNSNGSGRPEIQIIRAFSSLDWTERMYNNRRAMSASPSTTSLTSPEPARSRLLAGRSDSSRKQVVERQRELAREVVVKEEQVPKRGREGRQLRAGWAQRAGSCVVAFPSYGGMASASVWPLTSSTTRQQHCYGRQATMLKKSGVDGCGFSQRLTVHIHLSEVVRFRLKPVIYTVITVIYSNKTL
jgi:hypothetical protein